MMKVVSSVVDIYVSVSRVEKKWPFLLLKSIRAFTLAELWYSKLT